MLSAQEAQRALAERRERAVTRGRLTAAFGKVAGVLQTDAGAAVTVLEALPRRARRAAFGAVCSGMGGELATVFENAGRLTYQNDWDRRPFRAPTLPHLARARVLDRARNTAPELVAYGADSEWLARWAGHVLAQDWQVSPHLVGWLLAAAIDAGNDEVLELLLASTDGSDDVATMGQHVPIALLCADRPDGWERVEELLLSAQREEGLRQSILEVVDEAYPEALRRMLALILEHGLARFASVARAVAVWFGLEVLAGDRKRIEAIVERALHVPDEPTEPLDIYIALWSQATEDVLTAIESAQSWLESPDPEARFSAVAFLSQTHVDQAAGALLRALDDDDLRVAGTAVAPLLWLSLPASYDVFERLLARLPKRTVELEPIEWYGPLPTLKREDVGRLLMRHRDPPDIDRVLPHRAALETWDRRNLVKHLTKAPPTADRRAALLEALGDASPQVREEAIAAAATVKLDDEEALALEPLLRRKPGDLRRGVIELILGRGEPWARAAAERLLAGDAQQRLAGVEVLRRLAASGSTAATKRLGELENAVDDQVVEQATRRAVADNALATLTEADGFGLIEASELTPAVAPRETGFVFATLASRRVLQLLDELIDAHKDVEVVVDRNWGQVDRLLLGAVQYANLAGHHRRLRRGDTEVEVPLLELWQRFAAELPAEARDDDGLQLLRAHLICAEAQARYRFDQKSKAAADVGVQHFDLVHDVLDLLLVLDGGDDVRAGALDAAEAEFAALGRRELRRRAEQFYSWESPALELTRTLPSKDPEIAKRHWRLELWLSEAPKDRQRPPLGVVVTAFEQGAATEADLIDHLVGPRGENQGFWDLGRIGRAAPTVVERIRERIVAIELARGETPTAAAKAVRELTHSGGLDVVVAALVALGRERFVRGWSSDGEGRATVFSHMVATSHPGDGDTPERFAAAVREAKIADRRLRELACYAPQWAAHVEATLAAPGLAGAVWWLHAHTKDDRWDVAAELRAEWERSVADRTELSAEQLVDGAVDVRWFAEVHEQLDDELLKAAKYGSTAGGHKRAELFARAMRGDLDEDELLQRIEAKRHQDSVRALGLLPLADGDALTRRYEALHHFRRGSREFGKQRQGSEGRATDIGLENLARTAGFSDPARLTWAMEAAATADLAGDGVVVEHEDVRVALRVDADGKPEISTRRGEKTLKSVPAALRKVPEIKALTSRTTELRRQSARIRVSLEQAMVRGDELTGDELARYREHALLWPALSRLILVGEGTAGYPDGRVLRDHTGAQHAVGTTERLRIAHPLDLLERGDWADWQQDVLARRVVQPFKQVFRELYLPVDSERADGGGSRRYAGHQIQPGRARALLSSRGWRIDEYEGARRTDHHVHVAASLWFLNGFGSPADVEPPTLEEVRFTSTRDGRDIELDAVPARLFSETMRDLDLVVSVAHVAGVDPEASQSSLEMRASLVAETAAMLNYENVRIDGPRALIDGEIGRYSVHLGSAGVHQLPGGAVCIVPVHAQHRGRVFLPFADDDPKTAEIVAKVLLLARDRDIRDPTILEQLRG
ncbi:DUF4132 domain-containing protein [Solirubrobacter soli]|uniref:DUF4132 domain-containing protein n=1 Tax=Solirubrobacter soli TaxID=363832 RepID=UPI00041CAD0C|nr:DUF4132 domain-containing protein [Solirubrobacter soli]